MYCILTIISRFSCRFLQLFEKVSLVAYSKYLRRITIIPKHDQFCPFDFYTDLRDILDLLRASNLYLLSLGKGSIEKKRFLSGIARIMGGGVYPCPNFLALFLEMHFWLIKKSLFLQKCQCIELLTVF